MIYQIQVDKFELKPMPNHPRPNRLCKFLLRDTIFLMPHCEQLVSRGTLVDEPKEGETACTWNHTVMAKLAFTGKARRHGQAR